MLKILSIRSSLFIFCIACATLSAATQQADKYPETSKVTLYVGGTGTHKQTYYELKTQSRMYWAACTHFKKGTFMDPDCAYMGKPISQDDQLRFRVDKDTIVIPANDKGKEEKLLITKVGFYPSPPPPEPGSPDATNGLVVQRFVLRNNAAVGELKSGRCGNDAGDDSFLASSSRMPTNSQHSMGNNNSNTPVVRGGVLSTQDAEALDCSRSKGRAIDSFSLITSDRIYEVTCMTEGPCKLNGKEIQLGDKFYVRVNFPKMWLSTDPTKFPEKTDFSVNSGLRYPQSKQ